MASSSKKVFDFNDSDSSDLDSEYGGNNSSIKLNKEFNNKYQEKRSKEEYRRLQDKYGDYDMNSDTGSSSDNEYAGAEDPDFDMDFFRSYAALETGNKQVMKKTNSFFKDKYNLKSKKHKINSEKPLTAIELQTQYFMNDDNTSSENNKNYSTKSKKDESSNTKSFSGGFDDNISDDDVPDASTFTKQKTESKVQKPVNVAVEFLKGKRKTLENKTDEKLLGDLKNKMESGMSKEDQYLMDYFINKRYLEDDDPDAADRDEHHRAIDVESLSEDEKTFENMQEFETKYRFRFEEPDEEFIRKYPRVIKDVLRQNNNEERNRADRIRKKDREMDRKEREDQEIKRMKALKRKEILDKIQQLEAIAGISEHRDMNFEQMDLDDDFDPDAHDKMMNQMFDEDYYNDGEQCNDLPKVDEATQREIDYQYEMLEQVELMDKGDFKYADVAPNSYGLTVEEILMAKDVELNKWFSLKKALALGRDDQTEKKLRKTYERRAEIEKVKQKILPSLYSYESVEDICEQEEERKQKKNRKKKLGRKRKLEAEKGKKIPAELPEDEKLKLENEDDGRVQEKYNIKSEYDGTKESEIEATIQLECEDNQKSERKKLKKAKRREQAEEASISQVEEINGEYDDLEKSERKKLKKAKRRLAAEQTVEASISQVEKINGEYDDIEKSEQMKLDKEERLKSDSECSPENKEKMTNKQLSEPNSSNKSAQVKNKYKLKSKESPKVMKRSTKKRKFNPLFEPIRGVSDERMEAYGNKPKKIKQKLLYLARKNKFCK